MTLDLNDKTTNANNLTNVNTVTADSIVPFAPDSQSAFFVSSSSQYLRAAESATLKPTGNFTIEAWVKTSTSGNRVGIFCNANNDNSKISGIDFLVFSDNKFTGQTGAGTGQTQGVHWQRVQGTTTVTDGNWHHGAFVYDGSNVYIYTDGVLEGTQAWTSGADFTINPPYLPVIGAEDTSNVPGNFFNGYIDELRIWSTNRTLTQIQNFRNRELLGTETNLNAYYPFNTIPSPSGASVLFELV